MKLPDISHLQFAILDYLKDGEKSGEEIREHLSWYEERRTRQAFYGVMDRLEQTELVKGRYVPIKEEGSIRPVRKRYYKVTSLGVACRYQCLKFYSKSNECHV